MALNRTNRTPWMDLITLISQTETTDADGYTTVTETSREVFGTMLNGVVRDEFYAAYKAGVKLSATVEIWQDDYAKETICEHDSVRYEIVRAFETGRGTLELSLAEVIR